MQRQPNTRRRVSWWSAPGSLALPARKDLRSDGIRKRWDMPPDSVYPSTFDIWQQAPRWPTHGEAGYPRNLGALAACLASRHRSPSCLRNIEWLAVAEREHRVHRIPRRPAVAATEFEGVGQQVGEALEVGCRTGPLQRAQRGGRVLLINGPDAGRQPLGNGTGVLVKKSW
jgi:hypothetical protein